MNKSKKEKNQVPFAAPERPVAPLLGSSSLPQVGKSLVLLFETCLMCVLGVDDHSRNPFSRLVRRGGDWAWSLQGGCGERRDDPHLPPTCPPSLPPSRGPRQARKEHPEPFPCGSLAGSLPPKQRRTWEGKSQTSSARRAGGGLGACTPGCMSKASVWAPLGTDRGLCFRVTTRESGRWGYLPGALSEVARVKAGAQHLWAPASEEGRELEGSGRAVSRGAVGCRPSGKSPARGAAS